MTFAGLTQGRTQAGLADTGVAKKSSEIGLPRRADSSISGKMRSGSRQEVRRNKEIERFRDVV
jgi:hypothetical protein